MLSTGRCVIITFLVKGDEFVIDWAGEITLWTDRMWEITHPAGKGEITLWTDHKGEITHPVVEGGRGVTLY